MKTNDGTTPVAEVGATPDVGAEPTDGRCMEGVDKVTLTTQKPANADESGVVLSETSWIDRLTPQELAGIDEFERRMLLDELEWRGKRLATVEEEKNVALAGANLIANAARVNVESAFADGVAAGVMRGSAGKSESGSLPLATSLDAAFREIVRNVVRTEVGDDRVAGGRAKGGSSDGDADSARKLLSIAEVAKLANVDPQTVRGWLKSGELRFVPLGTNGKTIRIRISDYDDYLAKKAASATKRVDLDDLATRILSKRRRRAGAK